MKNELHKKHKNKILGLRFSIQNLGSKTHTHMCVRVCMQDSVGILYRRHCLYLFTLRQFKKIFPKTNKIH